MCVHCYSPAWRSSSTQAVCPRLLRKLAPVMDLFQVELAPIMDLFQVELAPRMDLQPSVAQQLDAGCVPTIHGQRRWQMRLPPAYAERNRDRHSTTILLKFSYERR